MHYGKDYKSIPVTSIANNHQVQVKDDIVMFTNKIVNIAVVGKVDSKQFVLIDAGIPHSADDIISFVEGVYGTGAKPQAILLTHGHFDHVGSIIEMIEQWDVPVYAHDKELPYLTGKESYLSADPTVQGGMMAKMSFIYPKEPIDLDDHIKPLPLDGTVPFLEEFKWIHTPGHSPGHVSYFRERDGMLIAGDAFVTVKNENLFNVLIQKQDISGPPKYFTPDWTAAKQSIAKLRALNPKIAVTGHGVPVAGEMLFNGLKQLDEQFDTYALPSHGKYVD